MFSLNKEFIAVKRLLSVCSATCSTNIRSKTGVLIKENFTSSVDLAEKF